MSDSTSRHTHDDDTLRRMGVRYVIQRAANGTVTPRALGGQAAAAPEATALSLQSLPVCRDCAKWQEELDIYCAELNDGGRHAIIYEEPDGRRCACWCP